MVKKIVKKLVLWAASSRLLRFPRSIFKRVIYFVLKKEKGPFIFINEAYSPERFKIIELVRQIKKENELWMQDWEALQIYMSVMQTAKIIGDIAEIGVYKGGSAKLICEAKEGKKLHLFDTFNGLPELGQIDDSEQFYKGQFSARLDYVKNYLKTYKNIFYYKGIFPSTAELLVNVKFSFVHLDVDLYEGTYESLKFFYPRINKGGILISHDYVNSPGVKKAFDDFFNDKPEPVIEIESLGSQCLIVKT